MNIVLIGYRGTGKSTVAELLAAKLNWAWIDADVEIEGRANKSIANIFAEEGEEAFREMESAVVADLAGRNRTVIALGGGAVLREENRAAMRRGGKVVWLKAEPATLWQRISADETTAGRRPNLSAIGGLEEVRTVLGTREPLYRECADLEIDTEGKTPTEVADKILSRLATLDPGGQLA